MFGIGKKSKEETPALSSKLDEVRDTTLREMNGGNKSLPPLPPLPKAEEPEDFDVLPGMMPTPEERREEFNPQEEEEPKEDKGFELPEMDMSKLPQKKQDFKDFQPPEKQFSPPGMLEMKEDRKIELPEPPTFHETMPIQARTPTFFIRLDKYQDVKESTQRIRDLVGNLIKDLDGLEDVKRREQSTIDAMKETMKNTNEKLDLIRENFREPI